MIKTLSTLFGTVFLSLSLIILPAQAGALVPSPTYLADTPQQQICSGIGLTGTSSSSGTCGDQGAQVGDVLKTVINILSLLVGILSVIMIIISGFRFITSGGDSGKVASAKNTLIYALIGVVVVILSQALVIFVLNNVPH